ncbi:hypothetical protein EBME_1815 [bacterium endosymbiont of Mortierella elongata FMR23-6]|nr:hypothetical protein EBME_1815 [bacterium endosymbiont of Mortierella elongata FMR23-6]
MARSCVSNSVGFSAINAVSFSQFKEMQKLTDRIQNYYTNLYASF